MAREIDDRWSVAYMLQLKAGVAWRQGRYDRAVELGEESLSGMRALGDRTGIGIVLWHLASARCQSTNRLSRCTRSASPWVTSWVTRI